MSNQTEKDLYRESKMTFAETGHDDPWRNELAKDLNAILARVQYSLETGGDESDMEFSCAALRVIARVADFEGIDRQVLPFSPPPPNDGVTAVWGCKCGYFDRVEAYLWNNRNTFLGYYRARIAREKKELDTSAGQLASICKAPID